MSQNPRVDDDGTVMFATLIARLEEADFDRTAILPPRGTDSETVYALERGTGHETPGATTPAAEGIEDATSYGSHDTTSRGRPPTEPPPESVTWIRDESTVVPQRAERPGEPDLRSTVSPGTRIDRYVVATPIASGGFASVFHARHVYINRAAVMKVLRHDLPRYAASSFIQEAQALGKMDHPGVVRILDASVSDGLPYIAMEHVEGVSLREHFRAVGTISATRAMDLLGEVCKVLSRQEELGIVHCDLKPANLFLRTNGRFCVIDYGIARVERTGGRLRSPASIGRKGARLHAYSPGYASPEQVSGSTVDRRSDLFSLGVVLWEGLTGHAPPRPPKAEGTWPALPSIGDHNPNCPRGLASIVEYLTRPRPEDRYQSANEVIRQLDDFRYRGKAPDPPLRGSVFVGLPFRKRFDPVFEAVHAASLAHSLEARRMDRLVMVDDIWGQIVQEIEAARLVICDFSPDDSGTVNPNVVTEAAHARAIGKPLIVLCRAASEALPFDWRHFQVLEYEERDGYRALVDSLDVRLRHIGREAAGSPTDPDPA